ncbi:MAG: endonuclease/exonuclease/phosphatase family protein, partial [Candidatus Dormibacteraeota bacterium]|nr:endonuclease/exonuclease/phosphatase family protein [Candidatus Dormibacteraeota bacterium]
RTRTRRRTLRIATYNILLGAERREGLVESVLHRIDADVIALQEVTHTDLARRLAAAFDMQLMLGEPSDPASPHTALLSRLPVLEWRNQRHPGRMLRSHLHCRLDTGSAALPALGVHCVHLAARFGERAKGEARRLRELTAVFGDMRQERSQPHLVVGDFNALSPGDPLAATQFFQRMSALRRAGVIGTRSDGLVGPINRQDWSPEDVDSAWLAAGIDPRLEGSIPVLPRVVGPLTGSLPVHAGVDRLLGRFIERWTVERMQTEGYVDCFRQMHPRAKGFTCATWSPAARIDYAFATREVAELVSRCDVVGGRGWPDPDAAVASDHFPLVIDFAFPSR